MHSCIRLPTVLPQVTWACVGENSVDPFVCLPLKVFGWLRSRVINILYICFKEFIFLFLLVKCSSAPWVLLCSLGPSDVSLTLLNNQPPHPFAFCILEIAQLACTLSLVSQHHRTAVFLNGSCMFRAPFLEENIDSLVFSLPFTPPAIKLTGRNLICFLPSKAILLQSPLKIPASVKVCAS